MYNYFAQNYTKLKAKNNVLEQKYENCTKNQLKRALKQLKTQTTNQIQIKYVSKILWSRYKKTRQDDIDQQTCYTENFWKYCENTFQPQGYVIKPECYQTPVINVSKEAFQNHHDLLYWHGSHLTFQQMNSILRNQHLEK